MAQVSLALPLVPLLLVAAGCTAIPAYAPPPQHQPPAGMNTGKLRAFVRADEEGAEKHFLRDVSALNGNRFRWTGQHPAFQFQVPALHHQKFRCDFFVNPEVLSATGTLAVTWLIDGQPFDRTSYDKPGQQRFEKDVPPQLLHLDRPVTVEAVLDKARESAGGSKQGLILTGAGFVE